MVDGFIVAAFEEDDKINGFADNDFAVGNDDGFIEE